MCVCVCVVVCVCLDVHFASVLRELVYDNVYDKILIKYMIM